MNINFVILSLLSIHIYLSLPIRRTKVYRPISYEIGQNCLGLKYIVFQGKIFHLINFDVQTITSDK